MFGWRSDDGSLDEDSYSGAPEQHGAELFVDAGINLNKVRIDLEPGIPITTSNLAVDPHFGLGARRAVSANNDLGVRLEVDQVDGHSLVGVRAVDYRYRFTDSFAVGLSFGGVPATLRVPFAAVSQFHDPAVEFALTFHADAGDAPAEEHEAAENDAPEPVAGETVRDDGSNVVNVDFTRKK